MLLGREYYQQALLEPIVVWGAMGVHLGASAVRRWLRPPKRTSWHALAGLALLPVVAWHVCLNRLVPMTSRAPIAHLSPSELDMAHVGAGLQTFPIVTWCFYTWLCVAGAVHMVGGLPKLPQTLCTRAIGHASRSGSGGRAATRHLGHRALCNARRSARHA